MCEMTIPIFHTSIKTSLGHGKEGFAVQSPLRYHFCIRMIKKKSQQQPHYDMSYPFFGSGEH